MNQSIKTLESHNAHRRGDEDGKYKPAEITKAIDDCVKDAKRYELVRTLKPHEFRKLSLKNIYDGDNFDEMIDKLIKARTK